MPTLPQPFLDEIRAQLGEEYPAFLASYDQPHVASLRLNPLRDGAEALAEAFIEAPVPWEPFGRYVRPDARPGLSLAHFGGAYYMQEASAMLAAAALDVQPGMKVLDLCAAPGGKSGQLLRKLDGRGLLVSNEPDAARARMLAGNLERLGAVNAVVTNEYPQQLEAAFAGFFDAVQVDAPCSGEGMFRRDPNAIAEWNPGLPEFCRQRQLTILNSAAAMLRPGGQMVFSTCTFNRTENEGVVEAFLAAHPEFAPEDFSLPGIGPSASGMLRAWPHRLRGEGHFVCRLRKAPGPANRPADRAKKGRPRRADARDATAREALNRLLRDALGGDMPDFLAAQRLCLQGDRLFCQPDLLPSLDGIRSPKPGLALCRAGKNYVEPDHSLAMALRPEQAGSVAALDDSAAWRYLAGEALPCEAKGWTLVTWKHLPLGWGKASGGQLKNHLPKGLRRPQGAPACD
ncbi:MAG: RsmB/NOP family class I SAM-dependent RNA methyltransferase [Clostridia bacterium]|nr:RsmB/NOP family class I SAM-dependent RNA methyltransferase [Clostridia bacterium]